MVEGDAEALERVAEWLSPLMATWARLHLGAAGREGLWAEDLVQETWLAVLPELPRLRPVPGARERFTPALLGLVKRILRNKLVDARRRELRRRVQSLPPSDRSGPLPPDHRSGPVTRALRSERRRSVQDALERLGARERELFVRRIFEDAGLEELANDYGMTRDAVVKARQRTRARLARYLSKELLDVLEDWDAER